MLSYPGNYSNIMRANRGNAMPFVPVTNVAKAVLSGTVLGEVWANQLYIEHPTAWNLLDLATTATDLSNWWNTFMKGNCHNSMTLTRIEITDLTVENGLQAESTPTITGTRGTDSGPNNVVAAVNFYTGVRGRAFRGRNFVSGATETDIAGNTFLPAYIAALLDAYAEINGSLSVVGAQHVHVTFNLNGVKLSEGIETNVLDYRSDGRVHSMRRRLPK